MEVKKTSLWILTVATGLLGVCLAFVSIISIRIGLENTYRPGFWVPISAGASLLLLVTGLSLHIIRRILRHTKEEHIIKL